MKHTFNIKFVIASAAKQSFLILGDCLGRPSLAMTFIFSFSFFISSAQFDFTKEEVANAVTEIQQLKNSVLVVRLKTKQKQIQAYREAGRTKVARKIEEKALFENLRIISACIKYFNFCKIYFINTEDVEYFQKTDRLILSNLLPLKDSVVTLPHDSVYYLDYGYLYGRQRVNEWTYKDYDNTVENSQIISENAFVIRNRKSEQLTAPLPFYKVVWTGGGKKNKTHAEQLKPYLQLNAINSNSTIEKDLQKVNAIDASVIRLNIGLIDFYTLAVSKKNVHKEKLTEAAGETLPFLITVKETPSTLSVKDWYDNNPNAELYPKWVDIQKEIQSLQNANPQFIRQE